MVAMKNLLIKQKNLTPRRKSTWKSKSKSKSMARTKAMSKSDVTSRIGAKVAIIMGSHSDLPVMEGAKKVLTLFRVPFFLKVLSAHRTPDEVSHFAKEARSLGFQVIIAGAGGAAHLPGMVAAHTPLPVIGVPVPIGALQGQDALLSIVQMPKGVPVATVAIGNSWNAGLLAVQILGAMQPLEKGGLLDLVSEYKEKMRVEVLKV